MNSQVKIVCNYFDCDFFNFIFQGSLDKTLDENETAMLDLTNKHEEELSSLTNKHSSEIEELTVTFQTEIDVRMNNNRNFSK